MTQRRFEETLPEGYALRLTKAHFAQKPALRRLARQSRMPVTLHKIHFFLARSSFAKASSR